MTNYFFIGIGGVSLSGLAEALNKLGHKVSGSDMLSSDTNAYISRLKSLKINCFHLHKAENVPCDADFIVKTSTVSDDNPEIIEAKRLNISIITRWQLINRISKYFEHRVSVTGAIGKTTVSALLWHALSASIAKGDSCSFIIGTAINGTSVNLCPGSVPSCLKEGGFLEGEFPAGEEPERKQYLVIESDESDASFVYINCETVIITGLEFDHLDHPIYGNSKERYLSVFKNFILDSIEKGRAIIYFKDCKFLTAFFDEMNVAYDKLYSYSVSDSEATFYGDDICHEVMPAEDGKSADDIFSVRHRSPIGVKFNFHSRVGELESYEEVLLPIFGSYNAQNAISALGCCKIYDLEINKNRFKSLQNIDKRFNQVGKFERFFIIDDYAHSPTKLHAIIENLESLKKNCGLSYICVFEPHKYARIKSLYSEYMTCLADATGPVVLMDIFGVSGYRDTEGITKESFCQDIRKHCPNLDINSVENEDLLQYLSHLIGMKSLSEPSSELLNEPLSEGKMNAEEGHESHVQVADALIVFCGSGLSTNYAKNAEHQFKLIRDNHAKA